MPRLRHSGSQEFALLGVCTCFFRQATSSLKSRATLTVSFANKEFCSVLISNDRWIGSLVSGKPAQNPAGPSETGNPHKWPRWWPVALSSLRFSTMSVYNPKVLVLVNYRMNLWHHPGCRVFEECRVRLRGGSGEKKGAGVVFCEVFLIRIHFIMAFIRASGRMHSSLNATPKMPCHFLWW